MNYFDAEVEKPLWQLVRPLIYAVQGRLWLATITVFALTATLLGSTSPVNASTSEPVTVESEAIFGVESITPDTILRAGGSEVVLGGFGLNLVEEIVFAGSEIADSVLTGTTTISFESLPVSSTQSVVSLELHGGGYTTAVDLVLADAEETVAETVESGDADASLGFIVKYKELASLPGAITRAEIATDGAADLSLGSDLGLGMRQIDVDNSIDAASADEVLRELESDPRIEWAEPVIRTQVLDTFPSIPPNDADYDEQWGLWSPFGIGLGTGTSSVSPAWNLSLGSASVVAVIDTGITDHEDLPSSQLVAGYDFVGGGSEVASREYAYGSGTTPAVVPFDGDYINTALYGAIGWDSNPMDPGDWGDPVSPLKAASTWHGTKVAGLIGAKTNNSVGIAGVAPNVRIQPVRALSWLGGTNADLAAAITWASGGSVAGTPTNATPANVINMSLGGVRETCPVAVQTAVDAAIGRGVVLVAAAGNNVLTAGQNASSIFPANCTGVIAVGATASDGKRAWYSNYGSTVDLSAPGTAVSTTNLGTYTPTSTTTAIQSAEGTSFAAPLVAGVAALLKSMDSGLSPAEIGRVLTTSVRPFAGGVCDADPIKTCGSGIVDASLATVALNNSLSSLGVSGTALSPSFNRMGTSYAASVTNDVSQVVITPTKSMPGGSLTVNGSSVTSGVGSTVSLAVGSNLVNIVSTGAGGYGSVTYSVAITRAAPTPVVPVFTSESPSGSAVVGVVYGYTFVASGEPAPVFSVTAGSLPAGVLLDAVSGVLSGTPSVAGTYSFQVVASNTAGSDVTGVLTIVVSAPAPTPVPPSPSPPPSPPSPDSGSGGGSSPAETPVAALAVTSFAPTSGSTAGGTLVTVNGSGFTGASQVLFGSAAAQIVAVVSDSVIRVLTPPGRAGTYAITVVGSSSARASSAGVYTYITVTPEPEDRIRVVNTVGGVERVVVDGGETPYRPTVVINQRAGESDSGRSIDTAPRVNVDIGVVVTPRVKGLPKSKRFGVAMLVPGADPGTQRMFMGVVRTNASGITILPATRSTEAGVYTYRLTRKGTAPYFVQLRAVN